MCKKVKREEMNYNKAKWVCSNCEASNRVVGQSYYVCYKMADENNWVQPHGFCDYHSAKIFQELLDQARNGCCIKSNE